MHHFERDGDRALRFFVRYDLLADELPPLTASARGAYSLDLPSSPSPFRPSSPVLWCPLDHRRFIDGGGLAGTLEELRPMFIHCDAAPVDGKRDWERLTLFVDAVRQAKGGGDDVSVPLRELEQILAKFKALWVQQNAARCRLQRIVLHVAAACSQNSPYRLHVLLHVNKPSSSSWEAWVPNGAQCAAHRERMHALEASEELVALSSLNAPASQVVSSDAATCATCGAGGKLFRCSRCKKIAYCSAACQKCDWKRHRAACGEKAALMAADLEALVTTETEPMRRACCLLSFDPAGLIHCMGIRVCK